MDIEQRIVRYLSLQWGEDEPVSIVALSRIHGGASRETFRVRVRRGVGAERGLIFRRDPVSTLIETEREIEFAAYRSFQDSAVPVPRALFLERGTEWLDRPFFVMEEIEGCSAGSILAGDPYGAHRRRIGEQFHGILGRIAAQDAMASPLAAHVTIPAADEAWRLELAKWEKVIDEDELEPQPIARAVIRHLKANPPPPAQKVSVVHGDYRTGNFLFDATGTIRAILDWEMAHIGDPLEDLAWALDPLWSSDRENPGGMLPRSEAIAIWEKSSGLVADPRALQWWTLFASLKGLAIWISSAKEFQAGTNTDPVMAFSGLYCLPFHNKRLADLLAEAKGVQP
ncbi:MAG: phosphotransferase family protein [Phycisphaerae bacterium]|jgi:aminoglycoside phosphotransferase (APT) family kinase protein